MAFVPHRSLMADKGVTRILLLLASVLFWHTPIFSQTATESTRLWLENLDLSKTLMSYETPQIQKSMGGNPLSIHGTKYAHGVGSHSVSIFTINLNNSATMFSAVVGVDDEVGVNGLGSVVFSLWVDGHKVADSGIMRGNDEPKRLSVSLRGAKLLRLKIDDASDGNTYDHADWADAYFELVPGVKTRPEAIGFTDTATVPQIASCTPKPRPEIHGPRIIGTTPGHEFIFRIPATGLTPLTFAAENLPTGLSCDPSTGVIRGAVKTAGTTVVTLRVSGPKGTAVRKLTIVAGAHKRALTPPMGWNSWNVWGLNLDEAKVRAAADVMIKSGLTAHGYQYVNIDDAWQDSHNVDGIIIANKHFSDMKALADYVHAQGLKIGLYSSPGPKTCGGYEGSFGHEVQDAQMYAKWGFDYLKYDWCTCTSNDLKAPYKLMQNALDNCGRDIFYSLCQYGMGNVWKWGPEVRANSWRTNGDITDTWGSMSGIGFSQSDLAMYAGPGHWNDPDMLVVGKVGWGNPHPSGLTKQEQLTHITLWSLVASPLLIGCDMTQLDPFTRDLLCNDEVIDVDQDPLGKAAACIRKDDMIEIWARPLWDGTKAVGLFNRGEEPKKITVNFASDLGISAKRVPIRDLWMKKQLRAHVGSFTATVQPHGAVLVKVGNPTAIDAYIPAE